MKAQIQQAKAIKKQMTERVADLATQLRAIRDEIAQQILDLPQNPRITPVGQSGAFSIKMSDLGTRNWAASYHDFKAQYEQISKVIERSRPENVLSSLQTIIKTGRLANECNAKLHPDVVANLNAVIS